MASVTIVNIVGRVFTRDENGNLRELSVGDKLQEGDVLITAPMSVVEVDFNDGLPPAVFGASEVVTINSETDEEKPPSEDESALDTYHLNGVLALLENNLEADVERLLEGTPEVNGGGKGGVSFVRLVRITETVEGVEYAFDTGRDNELTTPEFSAFLTPDKIVKLIDVVLEPPGNNAYNEDEIVDGIKATVNLGGDVKVGDALFVVDGKDNILFDGPVTQEMLDDGLIVTVTDLNNNDNTVSVIATVADPEGNSATDRDDGVIDAESPVVVGPDEPTLSVADAGSINEGDTATFDVSLSNPVDNATTLTFELDGEIDSDDIGTPTASIDGTEVTVTDNGNGTFSLDVPAGTTDGIVINVPTIDDDVFEGPEDFTLTATLTGETESGTVLPEGITDTGNATIVDDGSGTPDDPEEDPDNDIPVLSVADAGSINEGDTATFDVSLSNPVDNATTLTFELDGEIDSDDIGTPTASIDGTEVTVTDNGNGTFSLDVPAGTTDGIVINVPTIDDDVFEGPEDFTLTATLTGETESGTVLPEGITDTGNATIVDDGSGTPDDPEEDPDNDIPVLSVADAGSINEGDTATFDVSLSNPVDNATTLTFELDGEIDSDDIGTPTASIDGTEVTVTDNGNGTFSLDVPAGTTDGIVINVPTIDDDVFEGPEDFTLTATLTGETESGTVLPEGITDTGNATIVDDGSGTPDDPEEEPDNDTPVLSVADAGTINEGDTATFDVSLSNPVDNATTLTFELDGEIDSDDIGTPTASIDGTEVTVTDNGNGTFSLDVPAGTTDGIVINVPTIDDDVFEGPEDFTLTATLTGETTAGNTLPEGITDTGNATIVDDGSGTPDDPEEDPDNDTPVLSVADAGTINEGDTATFDVSLSNPVDNATTLTFELDGEIDSDDIGTPTASIDGTEVTVTDNGNGTFSLDVPAGTTDGIVISVPTIDDDVFEGPEDFTLTATLTGETTAGNTLPEGITDTGNATIVDDGSGTPDDPEEEPDNDTPVLSVADAGTINEGDTATFDVSLSNPVDNATTLTFELDGEIDSDDIGTPTASIGGTDVTVTDNGNGTFSLDVPAGTTDGIVISVPTIDDDVFEGPEDFTLTATLTGETESGTVLPEGITDTGNATIVDDGSGTPDDPEEDPDNDTPVLSVADAGTINEGDTATFDVSLSNPVDNATTLTFELDGEIDSDDIGTPTASIDGTEVTVTDNGNGTFSLDVPAGTTDGIVISVPTIDDDVFEGPEDFTLTATLTGETESGTVLPEGITDTGNATIVDDGSGTPDDPEEEPDNDTPVLSVADAGTINEGDTATFDVSLSNPVDNATTLTFELDGEADAEDLGIPTASIGGVEVAVTDNGNGTFSLDVPAGTTDGIVISVPTIDDDVFEGPEDFTLTATLTGETENGTVLPEGITDTGNATIVDENPIIEVITTTSDLSLITSDAELVDQDSVRLDDIFSYRETNYGEDGVQAIASWSYSLELVENANTSLTSGGSSISLAVDANNGDIIATANNNEVFRVGLSEDEGGNAIVKLTQSRAIDHVTENTNGVDVDQLLLESSVINLSGAVTAEYGNGYVVSASESIDLGGVIAFNDDIPAVIVSDVELEFSLTTLDSETVNGTSQASDNAASPFESAVTAAYGADGAGSTAINGYRLTLDGNVDTASIASGGEPVLFSLENGEIIGRADGSDVLRINIDPASGDITVVQSAPLDHPAPGADTLSLPTRLVGISADVTVTDSDGDTATETLSTDLSATLQVVDDVPSTTLVAVDLDAVELTTLDSETVNGTSQVSDNAASPFESAVTAAYGADGAGSTAINGYRLTLDGNVDTASIASGGEPVLFSLENGEIIGRADGSDVLRINIDPASGDITVVQSAPLDHPAPGADTLSLPTGLVGISADVTVTDSDGDTATETLSTDLSATLKVVDDVPSATLAAVDLDAVELTTLDSETVNGTSQASDNAASPFESAVTAAYGADGAGSTAINGYRLTLDGNVDTASIASGGEPVLFSLENGEIIGRADGSDVLRINIDPASGDITVVQSAPLDHPAPGADTLSLPTGLVGISADVTVTDSDGDTATETLSTDLSATLKVVDDVPSATLAAVDLDAVELTTLDSETVNGTSQASDNAASPFESAVTAAYGADGAGSTAINGYRLTLDGNVDTASIASGGEPVLFSLENGEIIGRADGSDVLRINIDPASGDITVVQSAPLDHPAPGADTLSLPTGLVGISADVTVTDSDGDTVTETLSTDLSATLKVVDDVPSATLASVDLDAVELTTLDSETVNGTSQASDTAASSFESAVTAAYGADGAGSTAINGYRLTLDGNVDTASIASGGEPVLFSLENGEIIGRADGSDVLRINIDPASGDITVIQSAPLDHPAPGADTLSLPAGLVGISADVTVTDSDGDTVTETLSTDLSATLKVVDDVPSATLASVDLDAVELTTLDSETVNGTSQASDTAASSFESAVTAAYGADGAGSTAINGYRLTLDGNVDTASIASGGEPVLFSLENGEIIGRADGSDVLRINIDPASGDITVVQSAPLDHPAPGADTLSLPTGLVGISADVTVTDSDGDTATETLSTDLSATLKVVDDVPSATLAAVDLDAVELTTLDSETVNGTSQASDNAASPFESAVTAAYGADGAGSTAINGYRLTLDGNVDTASIASGGEPVLFSLENGEIIGRADGSDVLRINIDPASGDITVVQSAPLDHPAPGADTLSLPTGLVGISADVTVTDSDGDTVTETLSTDLSATLKVVDDVPVIDTDLNFNVDNDPTIKVDERYLEKPESQSFASIFSVDYGADGEGSTDYSLEIEGDGATTLISTLSGETVKLVNQDGNIEGRTVDSNELVFAVEVDSAANITLTQYLALRHPIGGGSNDELVLPGSIKLNATAIDSDGDSTTQGINLGQFLKVRDDGPLITIDSRDLPSAEASLSAAGSADFSGAFVTQFGADGEGGISYALSIGAEANLTDAASGQSVLLSLVDGRVEGRTEGDSSLVFEVSVNNLGEVTLEQYRSVTQTSEESLTDNLTLLARSIELNATAEDGDEDSLTGTLGIGANLVFEEGISPSLNPENLSVNMLSDDEPLLALSEEPLEVEESLATENSAEEPAEPSDTNTLGANELLSDDEETLFTEDADETASQQPTKEPESSLATPAYAANAHEDLDTSNNSIDQ
ncbi:retention module-containing protein [Halomonas sp. CH40]